MFKLCARRGSRCRPSKLRRNRLTSRSRRTAAPPLNSSVIRTGGFMGFAISWLAVSGKAPEQVLKELRLNRTGENEEIPESPISAAQLPNNWFLVFINEFDSPIVSANSLASLSTNCKVVSCQIEEHVMFSSATLYSNGTESWRVAHDAQEGMFNLSSSGQLPSEFAGIYTSLKNKQEEAGGAEANVNYIHDVPVTLAQVVTSFRHDEDIPGLEPVPFEVLGQDITKTSSKPWWRLW